MERQRQRWRQRLVGAAVAAGLAALALSFVAGRLDAQMASNDEVDFEVRAGPSIPGQHLSDIVDAGLAVGAAARWWVTDHVAFMLDGNVDVLPGEELSAAVTPDTRLYSYGGGLTVGWLSAADSNPWSLTTSLGAGATTIDTDDFAPATTVAGDFTETYFQMNGGVRLGYDISRNAEVALGVQSYLAFLDEEDTAVFATANPNLDPFDTGMTFPVTLTFQWAIPAG